MKCDLCESDERFLLKLDCPEIPNDDMGEGDGTMCVVCGGSGQLLVCASCFYGHPEDDARE